MTELPPPESPLARPSAPAPSTPGPRSAPGRSCEYGDHTAKDLLALPTSRTTIVAAKFTLAAAWALLLAAGTTVGGLLLGALPALPGWSAQAVAVGVMRILVAAALAAALTTPLALAAGIGRGYLAAVGVLFVLAFAAQIIAALGFGAWFPYSVPGLYGGHRRARPRPARTDQHPARPGHQRSRGGGNPRVVAQRRPRPLTRT
ncbi:ABC transporter permease [Nonomuraea dietziae]|uniref:ABC transporter permease n=1 Tax=Nonomuraea dietziae TaxID=65515 RepID=UPI0033D0EAB4